MTDRVRRWLRAFALPAVMGLSLPACATVPAQAEVPGVAGAARGGPALWKVADEDTTIYIFGTVHALPADVEWFDGEIASALAEADELITEIPSGSVESDTAQYDFGLRAVLPPGQSLRDLLNPRQRAIYEAALTRQALPLDSFDRFKPWFVAMTLGSLPLWERGYTGTSGVEAAIDARANATTSRGALETVATQIALFDGLPTASQVALLVHNAETIDRVVPHMDAIVAAWASGDAERLAALMNEGLDDRQLATRLLYDRNGQWAQWIVTRLERPGTSFLAVGAGHLAGARSVQDVLDRRGITVTRIQ